MPKQLSHNQIEGVLTSLGQAKIVNLDAPVRELLNSVAGSLRTLGVPGEVSLHIVCCDEYAIVTGATAADAGITDVREQLDALRGALFQSRGAGR
jgi:hypothetical protein